MNEKIFMSGCETAFNAFKDYVPNPKTRGVGYYKNAYGNWQRKSTGNMAFNASKIEFPSPKVCKIYTDDKIAPSVPFTNEKWISPKWKGHKNPNEGWFGRVTFVVAKSLAKSFKAPFGIRRIK